MRLFVALIPPEPVLDEVAAAFAPYRADWPHLRWTHRDTWHVTLAFYGEVDEPAAERLRPRLERAAARHPRRELAFAGAGAFPRARSARTLWTGIETDLQRLADSCRAAGRREGIDTGRTLRFHPHLTVARTRAPRDLRPVVEGLQAYEGTPWTAGEIHLVQSHLGGEVRYETLCRWPLRDARASR
ncbi:RNA 2',3'-cyclic phosphodiesterase [Actinoallomurus acaciae]|uniref:RNA 2',3'-cyclic phosphodiesterase n=1 Tax=Actinoallomurus acaciae TaxID=502577 RepID=A0ABV5YIV8_9ACTN